MSGRSSPEVSHYETRDSARCQAACLQVGQLHSVHSQLAHESEQLPHWQVLWLQVGHLQSVQSQVAHRSEQLPHWQVSHSSTWSPWIL
ncbi:hypothetical protein KEM60_00396 [Austwickia sp. TVS 96-490-7B]|nr:hypothetical protein [Austwickia sp. TVS 96-490-7B]